MATVEPGKELISACCAKCGCPVTTEQPYSLRYGLVEHKECPTQGETHAAAIKGAREAS